MEKPNQKVEGKRVPPFQDSTAKEAKETNPKESGMTQVPSPKMNDENVALSIGKDESTAKQEKGANPKELGPTEVPSPKMNDENVALSIGKDEPTAKQVDEASLEGLQLVKMKVAASQAIEQAVSQLQSLQSQVENSNYVPDLKNSLWMHVPTIEKSVQSLARYHDGTMTGTADVVLENIVSFLDRNERDVFVLVSHRMHSVVESFSQNALTAFLEKLKESHYVDKKWLGRVKEYAKRTGASTYRHMLLCAPQVHLYSMNSGELGDAVDGKHLVLPGRNKILCTLPYGDDCIEVLDLETRQRTGTFCRNPGLVEGFDVYLCGTHIVVCHGYEVRAKIFTMNGEFLHNVDLGIERMTGGPEAIIAPFGDFFYFLSESNDEGQCMISQVDVLAGQVTRRQQLGLRAPYISGNFQHPLVTAGKWLLCDIDRRIFVIDPTHLTVTSHFNINGHRGSYGITCSADNEFIAMEIEDGRHAFGQPSTGHVDILHITDGGELQLHHSLPSYPALFDEYKMIHGTTLYIMCVTKDRDQLVPIDAIDMASGKNIGRILPNGGGFQPFDLFTNGKEFFVAFQDYYGSGLCTVKAFPMANGK